MIGAKTCMLMHPSCYPISGTVIVPVILIGLQRSFLVNHFKAPRKKLSLSTISFFYRYIISFPTVFWAPANGPLQAVELLVYREIRSLYCTKRLVRGPGIERPPCLTTSTYEVRRVPTGGKSDVLKHTYAHTIYQVPYFILRNIAHTRCFVHTSRLPRSRFRKRGANITEAMSL